MKHFRLAGAEYRTQIDLTVYRTDIERAVKKVKPLAEIDVHKSYFITTPELSKRESIAVSTILRQGSMAELTTYRPSGGFGAEGDEGIVCGCDCVL